MNTGDETFSTITIVNQFSWKNHIMMIEVQLKRLPHMVASGSSIRINSSACFPVSHIPLSKIFLRPEINKTRCIPIVGVPDKHPSLVKCEVYHISVVSFSCFLLQV